MRRRFGVCKVVIFCRGKTGPRNGASTKYNARVCLAGVKTVQNFYIVTLNLEAGWR
jgi:hypothetical protein